MIRREASCRILNLSKVYPAVTVAGPRHAGKTTLVKELFPGYKYVNLENIGTREFSRKYPAEFLKCHRGRLIIDEFLESPELLPHIRAVINNVRIRGLLILVTSRKPLNTALAQPHRATQTLLPLTIGELRSAGINLERDEYIHRGFMPCAHGEDANPKQVYLDYLTSFVDHDAKRLITPYDRDGFGRFFKLLARRVGQIINPAALAKELNIPRATLIMWMTALEASFIIFRLPCYYKNLGMKVTRIPKFYFTDIGMAARLLKITSSEQVFRDPLVGNLFENMVVAEILKCRGNAGLFTGMYYFRHHYKSNLEIDLIIELEQRRGIIPIEIKCASAFDPSYARNIVEFTKMSGRIKEGYVVYGGESRKNTGTLDFINFRESANLSLKTFKTRC